MLALCIVIVNITSLKDRSFFIIKMILYLVLFYNFFLLLKDGLEFFKSKNIRNNHIIIIIIGQSLLINV